MVWGDCYEATYQWNHQKGFDLAWISRCDQTYFITKCRASPEGRDPTVFDCNTLHKNMKDYFADSCMSKKPMCPKGECECCDTRRKEEKLFDENGGWRNMEDEFTWVYWLRDNGDEVFGCDWWESVPGGKKLSPCIELHLEGLKAAFESLKKDTL